VPDEFDETIRLAESIRGWLTRDEGEALFKAAKGCTGRGVIVEIGSWRGKSTICLARGSQAGASVPVYAIDRHVPGRFEKFERNVRRAGVADLVRPIRSRSQDAADDFREPIELLFVDGAHDEAGVREDFEKWVPKVVEGGIVAFHDTTWHAGPRKVVGQKLYRSRSFSDVRFVRASTTMARKVAENTRADRLRARAQLAHKTAFWLFTLPAQKIRHRLPEPLRRFGRRAVGLAGSR
jgi:MMP 1-O-methyltransferase